MSNKIKKILFLMAVFSAAFGAACSGQPVGTDGSADTGGGVINLQGAGATFPKPIYEKWVSEYQKINPDVRINYQANGSGAGQKAILENTSDFGASDDPMKDEDLNGKDILHIPTVLGAVVITYNLADVKVPLKLSADTVAGIYLGNIKKWNDPRIKAENPDLNLPDADISPVYRADSSGTTAVFTEFLSNANAEWKEKVGANKQPSWITGVGVGAKGNDGVTGQIKNIPNSIGYVEIAFAKANGLPMAHIKNKAGNFVEPTIENVSAAAAASAASMPDDLRARITYADGAQSYPIASYTYILVNKQQKDAAKGKALVDFLWWAIHDGEKFTADLHYAPLPDEVVKKTEEKINSITADGKPLRQ
jgi:phosphate transport system substrate-binding protein